MAISHIHRPATRLAHRLALIVKDSGQRTASQTMRCAAYDMGLQLLRIQEQPLGAPAEKFHLNAEFNAPVQQAARLMHELVLRLDPAQLVLVRLETLGQASRCQPQDPTETADPLHWLASRRRSPLMTNTAPLELVNEFPENLV